MTSKELHLYSLYSDPVRGRVQVLLARAVALHFIVGASAKLLFSRERGSVAWTRLKEFPFACSGG